MHPNSSDWSKFYDIVDKACGVDLRNYKQHQAQRRIVGMMEARRIDSLAAFGQVLSSDRSQLRWFLDKLAINVSELFRNPERWETLRLEILPACARMSKKLKIWSAGCSYGAEAYTLAILLAEHFHGFHSIIGTDIDETALEQADQGHFTESDLKSVPIRLRDRYFELCGDRWAVVPSLKKLVSFKRGNLFEGDFGTDFDLIVCRNVVIYFNEDTKDELYHRFYQALRPGGYLFVGSTERVRNYSKIGFEPQSIYFYRKAQKEDQAWRNAS